MDNPAALHNDLERLADVARSTMHDWTAVSDPPSEAQRAAYAALRARLEAAGYSARHADWAVTSWILMGSWPVMRCVEATNEDGPIPQDDTAWGVLPTD